MKRKLKVVADNNSPRAVRRKKARRKRRVRQLQVVMFITILLASIAYITFSERLEKIALAQAELAEYEKQYEGLQDEATYYQDEIDKLENEEYVAKLAREKYFKSEKGEIIFKLPKSSEQPQINSDVVE